MVVDEIRKNGSFCIYGAQVVAYGAYTAIHHLCGQKPESFVVGSLDNNPAEIEGIPVRELEEVPREMFLIVGVTELVQKEVLPMLEKKGYRNVFALTQHEEHLLMSAYFNRIHRFPLLAGHGAEGFMGTKTGEGADLVLYEVRNHRDNPLAEPPELFPYERPIQAGAAVTDIRVTDLTDDTGDSISRKNRQYCEMSATYWVWKNTDHSWRGIEHYRRHLLVRPEMLHDGIDAVLPLPYICYPDTVSQFRRFVSEDVLDALLKALRALHPDEYGDYLGILHGKYQYTYNLVCARKEVFDRYCAWFFRITEYMETMAGEVPEIAETRALSYVAEVLTNLYFMHNREGWNIRHAEKEIYV